MQARHFILLFLLCGLLCRPGAVRAYYIKQYTAADGLNSNNVYHVFRSSTGYLWFATDKGVSVFDGRTFIGYTALDGLTDNTNFNFFEDRQQYIWPFSYNGRYCRIGNGNVENSNSSNFLKTIPELSYVNAMCYDADGTLYIGYINGDIIQVKNNKAGLFFRHNAGDGYITSIACEDGILKVYGNPMWRYFKNGKLIAGRNMKQNNTFYYNHMLFTADGEGLKTYVRDSLRFSIKDPALDKAHIIHIYGDTAGRIFCSTKTGLCLLNSRTGKRSSLLPGQKVTCCMPDISGDYWVTTFGKGAWCISKELDEVQEAGYVENSKIHFTGSAQLFINNDRNIYVPAIRDSSIILKELAVPFKTTYEPQLLHGNRFVYLDMPAGKTYFCDLSTHKIFKTGFFSKAVLPLGDNNYLAYGSATLELVWFNGTALRRIWHKDTQVHTICMMPAPGKNKAYILLDSTLCLFDAATISIHGIIHSSLLKDITGMFRFHGKILFTSTNPEMIIADEQHLHGMPGRLPVNNIVYNISYVNDSTSLFNTLKGDYIITVSSSGYKSREVAYPFTQKDYEGIYPFENNYLVYKKDRLYNAGTALLDQQVSPPVLIINKIRINGKAYDTARNIQLNGISRCEINITAGTLYFHGRKNTVQYRIVDNDTNAWNNIDGSTINILLSKFGHYQVQLRVAGNDAVYSAVTTISVTLRPPFYRTTPFYIIVVLLIIWAVVLLVDTIIARRRRAFISELNYLKMEHRSVNSLLNPHFVFNVINNIQGLINTGSKENASTYLAEMSTLIRQNMENLQFNLISTDKELNLVRNYINLQNMRFNHRITLHIHCETEQPEQVFIPPLLIHTFVENAVVHGFRDKTMPFEIIIDIIPDSNDYLLIRITDNGAGLQDNIAESALKDKTSLGISFNRKRLERIGAFYKVKNSISVTDRTAYGSNGTEVSIIVYSRLRELIQE